MALAIASPALSQDVPIGPPPSNKLKSFQDPNAPKKKEGLTAQAYMLIAGLGCVTFLGLVVWFRFQAKDLNIPEDESALAAKGASAGGSGTGLGSKESVYSALGRTGGWATAGRISMASGVDTGSTETMLQELVQEGRVKAGRDKNGRVLYRVG